MNLYSWWWWGPVVWARRWMLRLAMGRADFQYMARSLMFDPRLRWAKDVDIVVRQDGNEKRGEADWLKRLAGIVFGPHRLVEPK